MTGDHEVELHKGESILNKWKSYFMYSMSMKQKIKTTASENENTDEKNEDDVVNMMRTEENIASITQMKSNRYFIFSVIDLGVLQDVSFWSKNRTLTYDLPFRYFREISKFSKIYVFFYAESEKGIYNVSELITHKSSFSLALITKGLKGRKEEARERVKCVM